MAHLVEYQTSDQAVKCLILDASTAKFFTLENIIHLPSPFLTLPRYTKVGTSFIKDVSSDGLTSCRIRSESPLKI